MRVTVTFELDKLFKPEVQPSIVGYLLRALKATDAAKALGWSREIWERHFAGIFAEGNSEITVRPNEKEFEDYDDVRSALIGAVITDVDADDWIKDTGSLVGPWQGVQIVLDNGLVLDSQEEPVKIERKVATPA